MIESRSARSSVDEQWDTIARFLDYNKSRLIGGVITTETVPDTFYNLPLVLAYCILDYVLGQFIEEGTVKCKKKKGCLHLGDKMKSAKTAIPWKNYALVDQGRKARNDLAHRGTMLNKYTCIKYCFAIKDEFVNWDIIRF